MLLMLEDMAVPYVLVATQHSSARTARDRKGQAGGEAELHDDASDLAGIHADGFLPTAIVAVRRSEGAIGSADIGEGRMAEHLDVGEVEVHGMSVAGGVVNVPDDDLTVLIDLSDCVSVVAAEGVSVDLLVGSNPLDETTVGVEIFVEGLVFKEDAVGVGIEIRFAIRDV